MGKISFDAFSTRLGQVADVKVFSAWNEACDEYRLEPMVYPMDELDELVSMEGKTATEAYCMFEDDFHLSADWFYCNAYGRIASVWTAEGFFANNLGDLEELYNYLSEDEERMQEFLS